MNYDELVAFPQSLPWGYIPTVRHLLSLLRGTTEFDHQKDFRFLYHLLGYAAWKSQGKSNKEDFSGSDLILCLEHCLAKDLVEVEVMMGVKQKQEVEREPNWSVVSTACRKLMRQKAGSR